MKFRYKAFGLLAALILSLSVGAPALAVTGDDNTDEETLTVTLTETGIFAVVISGATLSSVDTSASSPASTSTGELFIEYHDSKSYRQGFDTRLYADNFVSNIQIPLQPAGTYYSIPASNLAITRNYDTHQGRWSSQGPRIGDIGPTSNGDDGDHSGGPYTGPNDGSDSVFGRYHNWPVGTVNRTLENDGNTPLIGFGFPGPGTAGSSTPTYGSVGKLLIELTVPAGQPAAVYTSTLHVTVTFGTWTI
jgi:hypothetical protein